jgi:hypothetical protein
MFINLRKLVGLMSKVCYYCKKEITGQTFWNSDSFVVRRAFCSFRCYSSENYRIFLFMGASSFIITIPIVLIAGVLTSVITRPIVFSDPFFFMPIYVIGLILLGIGLKGRSYKRLDEKKNIR